jgi:hypothetical protein
MTTVATRAADSWSISIGGGWIVLMLIGMALCFVFMLGFMWLMREGRGWAMCGQHWQQQTPRGDVRAGESAPRPEPHVSTEDEVPR